MKLTIIGTGYVGLPTGACLAEFGNDVVCVDADAAKVERLRKGECPIYEHGLPELISRNARDKRLTFTTSLAEAAADAELFFITVGTPARDDGGADLSAIYAVAEELGQVIENDAVVVVRSTVPVGTTERVASIVREGLKARNRGRLLVDFAFMPEFLKQGCAVEDSLRPDRIIIGSDSERAVGLLRSVFKPMMRNHERAIVMPTRSAEMTKYAANAMLAAKISFMNEMATLCDALGADIEAVRIGIGSDPRIGYSFIYPGIGYGGSCFPKDVKAILHMARESGLEARLINAVHERNQEQKKYLVRKMRTFFKNDLSGKAFAFWGVTFKPETDDLRDAPALVMMQELIAAGATVRIYDPVGAKQLPAWVPEGWLKSGQVSVGTDQYEILKGAAGLCLVTEWKFFRSPDFKRIKSLLTVPVLFDGRNQYDRELVEGYGLTYFGVGR